MWENLLFILACATLQSLPHSCCPWFVLCIVCTLFQPLLLLLCFCPHDTLWFFWISRLLYHSALFYQCSPFVPGITSSVMIVKVFFWPLFWYCSWRGSQETGSERGGVTHSQWSPGRESKPGPLQRGRSLCTWDACPTNWAKRHPKFCNFCCKKKSKKNLWPVMITQVSGNKEGWCYTSAAIILDDLACKVLFISMNSLHTSKVPPFWPVGTFASSFSWLTCLTSVQLLVRDDTVSDLWMSHKLLSIQHLGILHSDV